MAHLSTHFNDFLLQRPPIARFGHNRPCVGETDAQPEAPNYMPDLLIGGHQIPESAVRWKFVLSSGPGGQNVNKVATAAACRLLLDAAGLEAGVRRRLEKLAGKRLNAAGEVVVFADGHRTQMRNRQVALGRLAALLERAAVAPKPRIPTKPPPGAKAQRLEDKQRRSAIKKRRRPPSLSEGDEA